MPPSISSGLPPVSPPSMPEWMSPSREPVLPRLRLTPPPTQEPAGCRIVVYFHEPSGGVVATAAVATSRATHTETAQHCRESYWVRSVAFTCARCSSKTAETRIAASQLQQPDGSYEQKKQGGQEPDVERSRLSEQ